MSTKGANPARPPVPPWAWLVGAVIVGGFATAITGMILSHRKAELRHEETVSDFEVKYLDPEQKVSVLVLRDIEKVFPTYARDFKIELDLARKRRSAVEEQTAKTAAETKVAQLYEQLDVVSNDLRTALL